MSNIDVKSILQSISESVEPYIKEILTDNVDEKTRDMVNYQCRLGGKRIRPALVVIFGKLFGTDDSKLYYPAASIEVLHNSTLIIDDIIDHSLTRRDQPTTCVKYGQSMAECVAMAYVSSIYNGLNRFEGDNKVKLINLYDYALKTVLDGEIKDILFERSGREDEPYVVENRYKDITKQDYYKMIAQKTAVLIKASCMAGAICAGANEDEQNLASEFGYNIGMAFQIRDDILDIFGNEKEFGKKIGKDIMEKKIGNHIILSTFEQINESGKSAIKAVLESSGEVSDEDIMRVKALIDTTNARVISEREASEYIDKAFLALEKLPQNEYNEQLREIAKYIIGREK